MAGFEVSTYGRFCSVRRGHSSRSSENRPKISRRLPIWLSMGNVSKSALLMLVIAAKQLTGQASHDAMRVERRSNPPSNEVQALASYSVGLMKLREELKVQASQVREHARVESTARQILSEDRALALEDAADRLAAQIAVLGDARDALQRLKRQTIPPSSCFGSGERLPNCTR